MGKVLWTEDEERLNNTHPGCMSGIFHVLDYNVKKILPQRKHDMLIKRTKRNRRYRRISNDQDSFEVLKLLDGEKSHILVDQSTKKPTSTHKRSLKARVKALVSEEIFKGNHKEQGPRLQRTYSIHHLESDEWVRPIIFFPENVDNEELSEKVTATPVSSNEPSQNTLEIFKVDKKQFLNILQDGSQVSDMTAKLTKSGSFPAAYKSGRRNLRPSKLKYKLNEFYSASKNDKRLDNWEPKLTLSNSGFLKAELDKKGGRNSDNDLNNGNFTHIRGMSSLNESANRYTQLFDYSASKEAKLRTSRSLKLTNESESSSSTQAPSFFRRIRSLPHLDHPNQESHNPHFLRSASQNERNPVVILSSTEESTGLDSSEGTECLNGMIYRSDSSSKHEYSVSPSVSLTGVGSGKPIGISDDTYGSTIEEDDHLKAQEISIQLNPALNPESCSQEEKSQSEFQISKDSESLHVSEENLENKIKTVSNTKFTESSTEHNHDDDDDDFTYVREILERSGFIKNGFQQTWYSSNQPLDPLLFQELESQSPHDPEFFEDELIELSHHLLLFDLVNEVLLNMHQRSFAYYPKALSFSCRLWPAPTRELVLEEVWKSVSRLLNSKPDMNQSLDSIVFQDLADDGWMNLQLESECIALELEDLIFDELLEEVFCSKD